jgi:hypothetical protein
MDIDRQRIAAVRALEALGWSWYNGKWEPTAGSGTFPTAEADAMHAVLLLRADVLMSSPEGSEDEGELDAIADALVGYENWRWPLGKETGGKG